MDEVDTFAADERGQSQTIRHKGGRIPGVNRQADQRPTVSLQSAFQRSPAGGHERPPAGLRDRPGQVQGHRLDAAAVQAGGDLQKGEAGRQERGDDGEISSPS
jgi:hypothetical protein